MAGGSGVITLAESVLRGSAVTRVVDLMLLILLLITAPAWIPLLLISVAIFGTLSLCPPISRRAAEIEAEWDSERFVRAGSRGGKTYGDDSAGDGNQ